METSRGYPRRPETNRGDAMGIGCREPRSNGTDGDSEATAGLDLLGVSFRVRGLVLAGTLFFFGLALSAEGLRAQELDTERLLVEAWNWVRKDFHDPDLKGIDWDGVLEDYFPYAEGAKTQLRAHELINDMVSELEASHTALLTDRVYELLHGELAGQRILQAGCELEWRDEGFFVRSLHENGAAENAGMLLGDRVVTVEGDGPEWSPQVVDAGYDPGLPGPTIFYILPDGERSITVEVQRSADPEDLRVLEIRPKRSNCLDVARDSVEVFERVGFRFGKIHLWFFPGRIDEPLRRALAGPFKECDGLLLDMRGRGGYSNMGRRIVEALRRGRTRFQGRIVVLNDERTRSAKEMFADRFRRLDMGTIVGRRTEGAVIGAKFRRLSDGSVLMIGGHRVQTADGRVLEGVGVPPDVEVRQPVPNYAQGYDPIFEKGVEVLLDQCSEDRRRARRNRGRPRSEPGTWFVVERD